eukprot:scaffold3726_cov270-Pinguiococcus_pyrenoidosus.AAC.1
MASKRTPAPSAHMKYYARCVLQGLRKGPQRSPKPFSCSPGRLEGFGYLERRWLTQKWPRPLLKSGGFEDRHQQAVLASPVLCGLQLSVWILCKAK